MIKIAIVCGGESLERGISLNSARSFLDHTRSFLIDLTVLYVNPLGRYYQISHNQLYSNTPSDFDYKLALSSSPIEKSPLITLLRSMDLVFPLIHGSYGEDGALQQFLEQNSIPFVGSSSEVCRSIFDKYRARSQLVEHGFDVLPSLLIQNPIDPAISAFWQERRLQKAVLKPTCSGSSIGVTVVDSLTALKSSIRQLLKQGFQTLLLEPYSEDSEFTLCVIENMQGEPIALLPLEIDIGERNGAIFDFRKKYLPTAQTRYYCPARFSQTTLEHILKQAEQLFKLLNLRDFVRIDGWVSKSGAIRFSDFNPISGMEQNSFLFQQAAKIGLTHSDLIEQILNSALKRYSAQRISKRHYENKIERTNVYVLMGGSTAERQVSIMSGTNVWLKLLQDPGMNPKPFLLDLEHQVWSLPYAYALHHSVEEIQEHCAASSLEQPNLLIAQIRKRLGFTDTTNLTLPFCMSLANFFETAQKNKAFIFLALHGGIGEDGTLQQKLEELKIPFNGSNSETSRLCMDKRSTAQAIAALNNSSILPMKQISFERTALERMDECSLKQLWKESVQNLETSDLLIKPQADGCSAGVLRLNSTDEFARYIALLRKKAMQIPLGSFQFQHGAIDLPLHSTHFLLEPFVHTDKILLKKTRLRTKRLSGWCEMTIGILEQKGVYEALNPSITVASSHVLSLEEKFQGGTGVNLTPPPTSILSKHSLKHVRERACLAARALGIKNYARLDLFVECKTGSIRVIEANSLPALTPSTVFFHQGLSQSPPLSPLDLITRFILPHVAS